MKISIREQALMGCRRLFNQLNRDPSTPTFGCFDRKYWAWKLIDFPEATFQRNIKPLCWFLDQPENKALKDNLRENIKSGLFYALEIQHKDGSFDQAYPNEYSYGATAFLLPDLISAFKTIKKTCSEKECVRVESSLRSAANFLCDSAELHGFITNHLAGASLALKLSSQLFSDARYDQASKQILGSILKKQSFEGWFPEYGGADPGYQTLCMYYLAQIYQIEKTEQLQNALEKSLQFLQYFIHPDGTFGGEYGSRRTEIYYPGGIALLASEFPIAASMHAFMKKSIQSGRTITLMDIDMGNLAPLLSNFALAASIDKSYHSKHILPIHEDDQAQVFYTAGIAAISKPGYYAILGSSNGGILKVFSKKPEKLIYDDCGYLGKTKSGKIFSNQSTDLLNQFEREASIFNTSSSFHYVTSQYPSPFKFLLFRIANLTIMRIKFLNELVKKFLVGILINKQPAIPLFLERIIEFRGTSIHLTDKILKTSRVQINSLVSGIKFSSIHMASARYFTPAQLNDLKKEKVDVDTLNSTRIILKKKTIDLQNQDAGDNK